MRHVTKVLACVAVFTAASESALAGVVYMRSTVGQPWGQDTNETAMDTVFGAGNWQDLRYETVDPLSIFSAANSFAFLEGSDSNANELEAFLTANIATIEAWVNAGGSLFLNSAPNEGDGMNFGFGGISLTYSDFTSDPVTAVDPAHPIFNGPFAPVGTSFNGSYFGHGSVSGPGLMSLLEDDKGDTYLAEKSFGLGHVLFGGLTTTNFHDPDPQAFNLRTNILDYGAAQANQVVPEPASIALLGVGAMGLAGISRRRRRKELAA